MTLASIRLILAAGALACAALAADTAAATPAKPASQRPVYGPQEAPAPTGGGLVAIVDPETHQVRAATPAEIGAASARPTGVVQGFAAPAPSVHLGPGATVGVHLNGTSDVFSVMTKGPDGKLTMECVTGEKTASQRVAGSQIREAQHER